MVRCCAMSSEMQRADGRLPAHARLVRRSALILPVNVHGFVERAHLRGADAIVLDLEDSVPKEEKGNARRAIPEALRIAGGGGVPVLVRVNDEFSDLIRDLDACVRPELDEVVLPKVETPDQVKVLEALLAERELKSRLPEGKIGVNLLIESALGLERASSIVRAGTRVATVALGSEDLMRELNADTGPAGDEFLWAHGRIIMAAYASGVTPLGFPGTIAEYTDLEELRRAVARGRSMGYMGGYCIHPRQVRVLNEGFSPTDEQVEWARRVVEAFSLSIADGRSSTSLEGKMIDAPVADRARSILERKNAVEAIEDRKPSGGSRE